LRAAGRSERVFSLVVAQGFNAVVGFLFLPYLVRALSREQYGMYGQTLMIADTTRTIFSMGVSTVL
jgi:O-antigen/teichoic acid export membrane protein